MKHAKLFALTLSALALAAGCKDDHGHSHTTTPATQPAGGAAAAGGGGGGGDHHENAVAIGETTANGLTFKAMQDGAVKPGGEGAFDLKISGYAEGAKPKAVRFWVGTESAEGSTRSKAGEESPGTWHTHVEVPSPLPPGAKFWAEVEPASGAPFKVSFDVKQ